MGSVYREVPAPEAGPLVRCRWEQTIGAEDHVQLVIPDSCADVLVTEDGGAVLVGPSLGAEHVPMPAGTHVRGLRLDPAAIRAAAGVDAAELADRTVPLDAVLGSRRARLLAEAVWRGRGLAEFWSDAGPDPTVARVVRALTSPGAPSVDAIADRSGLSPRHLRRVVRAETGQTPKTLHRVARLHEFLRHAEAGGLSIAPAAIAAGYADQPHASREIRALTGLSPRELLATRAGTPT